MIKMQWFLLKWGCYRVNSFFVLLLKEREWLPLHYSSILVKKCPTAKKVTKVSVEQHKREVFSCVESKLCFNYRLNPCSRRLNFNCILLIISDEYLWKGRFNTLHKPCNLSFEKPVFLIMGITKAKVTMGKDNVCFEAWGESKNLLCDS